MKSLMSLFVPLMSMLLFGTAQTFAQEDESGMEARLQEARERLESAAREVAELSSQLAEEAGFAFVERLPNMHRKAMLGINLGDSASGDDGVPVMGVTPGGPADAVGIRAGDVLLSMNGESLEADGRQGPARKLLDLMRDVEPGDTVTLAYRRDGQSHEALVVAEKLDLPRVFAFSPDEWDMDFHPPEHGGFHHYLHQWEDMELVSLTPELGSYFGAEEGILVVRAPDNPDLKLEDGDVIRAIGGRTPKSPGHATRILRSYQGGEHVTIDILRRKSQVTLEIDIPEARSGAWHRAPTREADATSDLST